MNKVTLLLAAVLALPATAMAQTAPQPPAGPASATAPHAMGHRMSDADMAKIDAAHKALRVKILGSLTPTHKAYFANLIGQLAVATSPDWKAAAAKLNATLSATEKSKILAIHAAAVKQMETMMPSMGMPGMSGMSGMGMPGMRGSGSGPSGAMGGMMRMHDSMHMKHAMTAGDILMHLAGSGGPGGGPPMMMRVERFGHGDMQMAPMPMSAPGTPAPLAAPTSTP